MDDLIEALLIFRKYDDSKFPTTCKQDVLFVYVDPCIVSGDDKKRLKKLGFVPSDAGSFESTRFGNC